LTKAVEIHLMKGLATICGPNIGCSSVSPGLMMTEWGTKVSGVQSQSYKGEGGSKKSGHGGRCGEIR
jgi:hypothetical protein